MTSIAEFLKIPLRYFCEEDKTTSLLDLHIEHDRPVMVIDLWHTKCTKCPAALEKLDKEANKDKLTLYISIALSVGEGNFDVARDVSEGQWENLTKLFMDIEDKERAKSLLGFSQVPYYIVVDKDSRIVYQGDCKSVDLKSVIDQSRKENVQSNASSSEDKIAFDEEF